MSVGRFFVPAHISAGFIAPLVGYTSSAAIIFQAANSTGANDAMVTSKDQNDRNAKIYPLKTSPDHFLLKNQLK